MNLSRRWSGVSWDDMLADAYEENGRRDQERNLRDAIEEHLKTYIEESNHEGAPMSAVDFALYLTEVFEAATDNM